MTVPQQAAAEPVAAVVDAAAAMSRAAAGALPVAADVMSGDPVPAAAANLPAGETAAVTATLSGPWSGTVVLVVGPDVLAALQNGPLGPLDPAAALQPTIDAAAAAIGARADAAVLTDAGSPGTLIGATCDVAVPLLAGDLPHAALAVRLQGQARTGSGPDVRRPGLDLLRDVEMEVTVEIGRTRMSGADLLALTPGTVVELDRAAGSPADLMVNGTLLARGEIVVVDEDFGIRITEIVSSNLEANGASR
jgi:flagellar motor switch protein FliN/FliY